MEIYIAIGFFVLLVIYSIAVYNKLVRLKTYFENSFQQIDVHLKLRLDLIPKLISSAKAYMTHEAETFQKVTEARSGLESAQKAAALKPGDTTAIKALAGAEAVFGEAMNGFNLRVEAYPELKADQNMRQLSEEMTTVENKIAYARQAYNDSIQQFNEYKKTFPPIIFASILGFSEDAQSLVYEEDRSTLMKGPEVSF
ncbi:MAG: LemA family protein [Methyloprofundus sp.]|nr:LemA family protein [Methyloprofundus sp.]